MAKQQPTHDYVKGNFKDLYNQTYGTMIQKRRTLYTPEQLYEMAVKYFTWAEDNAIKAAETASFQGDVSESPVHKVRVFTINGLALFLCVRQTTLMKWRATEEYDEVMEFIDNVIYEQKFQLAANGIVNASFIGKEMGIDKPTTITVESSAVAGANAGISKEALGEAVKSILDDI